jgi:small-conductance mechanosensitive channel
MTLAIVSIFVASLPWVSIHAADALPEPSVTSVESNVSPVTIDGAMLFNVRGVSAFPSERRAREISARIEQLAASPGLDPAALKITEQEGSSTILADDQPVVTIFDADARLENVERKVLVQAYIARIREAILEYREERTPASIITHVAYIAFAFIALLAFLWLGHRLMLRIEVLLDRHFRARLEGLESQSFQIVRAKQIWDILQGTRKLLWFAITLIVILWYIQFALASLPWTRMIGTNLFNLLIGPFRIMGQGLLDAIPNLVFLTLLILVARYLLKAIQMFFNGLASGGIKMGSFDAEWAWPTYRLVRVFVIAFTLVLAFPYIPGSSSDAFKGVSVFLGIILSLGSSSVISNIIAGYTMTYRRAFRLGDRIQVGEHIGDVIETRLLVTHLQTARNEEIIVPNSLILNSSVVNYSTQAKQGQLILHTTVGIGYEIPWRQVEDMLLQAAALTDGITKEPEPFVMQKSLGDFCVTYELNVYCNNAQKMFRLYTALHRNILDVFNENDVQIMTPAYVADPPDPKIAPKDTRYSMPGSSADK